MKCDQCDAEATVHVVASTDAKGTENREDWHLCQEHLNERCRTPGTDEQHIRIPVEATEAQIGAEESIPVQLCGRSTSFGLHKRMKDGHSISLGGGFLGKNVLHLVLKIIPQDRKGAGTTRRVVPTS